MFCRFCEHIPLPITRQLMLERRCKIAARQVFQSEFEKLYGCHIAQTRSTIYAIHGKFLKQVLFLTNDEEGGLLLPPLMKTP